MGTKILTQEQAQALKAQLAANPKVMAALGITLTQESSKATSKKASKKATGKKAGKRKKAAKSNGNTGPACKCGCKQPIPAKFEPGFHPRREYLVACKERMEQERKDAYFSSDKGKRNQERKQERAAKRASKADETTENLLPIPAGVKLDRRGYPLVCVVTGALIPESIDGKKFNPVTAATPEAYAKRAKLMDAGKELPFGRNEIRRIQKQYNPVQTHPQGDGSPKSKPERKRSRTKRQAKDNADVRQQESSPTQTLDIPAEVAEAIRLARTKAGKARIRAYWSRYGSKWAKKLRKHAKRAAQADALA